MKKAVPHDFVLEQLDSLSPHTKPMFGCTSIYIGEKIVMILRERQDFQEDNGIWLATVGEHHKSLHKEFTLMRSLKIFGPGPTGWQVLPSSEESFEADALRACELILAGDPRIGKIPKSRLHSKTKVKKSKATRKLRSKK